jgi:hypothetical protein
VKYQQQYDMLTARYENLKEQLDGVREKKHTNAAKAEARRRPALTRAFGTQW